MKNFNRFGSGVVSVLVTLGLPVQPVLAQQAGAGQPESILPEAPASPAPARAPDQTPAAPAAVQSSAPADVQTVSKPVVQQLFVSEPVMSWSLADANALLATIEGIGSEGLIPADYKPGDLQAAIAAGEGDALDALASQVFGWLIEDLRDGRTPMKDRVQWFAVDPDQDKMPTAQIMAQALSEHDVTGVVDKLAPTNPDYAALKAEFNATPEEDTAKRALIQANMDRWRWLKRDLGEVYLMTNVPEFQLRLVVKNKIIRTYKTVVGKPGRTATPQLAETVSAVVFNPTWTVPQSIVKGEGLGQKVLNNPVWARNAGYKATKAANGMVYVVQQPGPTNSLGLVKIDMPNPHAIYLHDTPAKWAFNKKVRAFSHGCIRTERAVELGMTMAILGAQMPASEVADISSSRKYTKVAMTRTFPVYLTYFTYARSIDGDLKAFDDIYGRDKPVLASFTQPRELKTTQRKSDEEVIKLDNPL
ncbi:L,D-transpeptidase family protein [Novosphingobium beihaiensis]|uniref:L,D-transpeptidase family protein n=1 Tax=Novosphingobium beihaiensis TaxID=2930389 RepID=A0ABT0BQV2_9SPHN|nr:L,D-transpeptidase family protein [Novosphingobium beihaiensis]MCJ2187034.1 L,D-transpeptidase family protein [Novosphingobium beihaiensis]